MEYVIAVMGKYLQMLVAYSIFKKDPDQVADHFEQFNRNFYQVCEAFKEVTKQEFKAGQEVKVQKPVASINPVQRESKELGLSDNERIKLQQFLGRHNLQQELLQIFLKKVVSVADVFEMTKDEMNELGIKDFKLRKRL